MSLSTDRNPRTLPLLLLLFATSLVGDLAAAASTPPPAFPDARASDPVAMRWMVGDPPPPERRIAFYDRSYM